MEYQGGLIPMAEISAGGHGPFPHDPAFFERKPGMFAWGVGGFPAANSVL